MAVARSRSLLLAISLFAAATACQSPRTEVIIAVDADANILALSDAFRIEVTSPAGGDPRIATAMLSDGQPLPRTLGLYWSGGALGPYRAVVTARRGTSAVVSREATFSFLPDRTVVLQITLVGRCLSTTCTSGQTCGENGCRAAAIDPAELQPYTGAIARIDTGTLPIDGGVRPDVFMPPPVDANVDAIILPTDDVFTPPPDAFVEPPDAFVPADAYIIPDVWVPDGCTPATETCNGVDDDCDLRTDEDFDLATDPMNCGMCGNGCTVANGTPECVGSMCGVASCDMGFDDCNMDPTDGCETDLRADEMNCNSCGNVCTGSRECCSGTCRPSCM